MKTWIESIIAGSILELVSCIPLFLGKVNIFDPSFLSNSFIFIHLPGLWLCDEVLNLSAGLELPLMFLPSLIIWIGLSFAVLKMIDTIRRKRETHNKALENSV
jgi:hypothetical protein